MDDTVRNLQEIARVLNDIKASLPGLGRGVSNMSMVNKELQKKALEVTAAQQQLSAATKVGGKAVQTAQRSVNNLAKEYASLDSASKKTANLLGLSTKAAKDQTAGFARSSTGFKTYTNAIRQSHNILTSFNQNMGVQKLSFSAAYKSLIDYNKGMFTLSKTQRLFGREGNNVGEALKVFRTQTSLSTTEALEFTNAFNKMYLGIQPTSQEIAGFATMLQSSFGPNVEKTKEVMNTLLQLQQKFPPILNNIRAAHTAMAKGMASEAADLSSQNLGLLVAMGADTNQLKTVMQAQTKMTKNEEDLLTTEQKSAKAAQASKEAILNVGKTSEKVFQGMATVLEKTYGLLEKNTVAATLFAAAISAINISQSLSLAGGGIRGARAIMQGVRSVAGAYGRFKNPTGMAGILRGRGAVSAGSGVLQKGAGRMVVAANVGAGFKLASDIVGFGKILAKSKDELEKEVDTFLEKDTLGRLSDGILHSGKTIAIAARIIHQAATAARGEKTSTEDIDKGTYNLETDARKRYGAAFDEKAKLAGIEGTTGAERYKVAKRVTKFLREGDYESAEKKYGSEFTIKAKMAGVDKLEGLDKIKAVREIKKQMGKDTATEIKRLGALVMKYKAIESTLRVQADFQKAILDYTNTRVAVAGKFASITAAQLQSQIADSERALEISKKDLKNTRSLVTAFYELQGIKIGGLGKEERAAKIQGLVKEEAKVQTGLEEDLEGAVSENEKLDIENNIEKSISKQTVLRGQLATLSKAETKVLNQSATITEKKAMKESTLISQSEKFLSAIEQRVAAEKNLYEQAHFGMGASIKMLQKQIDLEKSRIKQAKMYTEVKGEQLAKTHGVTLETMKQIEAAGTEEERQIAINKALGESEKSGKKREDTAESLNTHVLKYNEHLGVQYKSQAKIFEMTKGMREGYLNAIMAMQINAGEFTKIIGTQDKATSQFLNTIHEATGKRENTLAMGGSGSKEELRAAGKMKTFLEFDAEKGAWVKRTEGEQTKSAEMLSDPIKNIKDLDKRMEKLRAGAEALSSEQLNAAMEQGYINKEEMERVKKQQNAEAAAKRSAYGKQALPVMGAKEKQKPGVGGEFGSALVDKSVAEMTKGEIPTIKGNIDTQMARVGQGRGVTAHDINTGGNSLGTITVAIDDGGGLKMTLINVKENIVHLQAATGIQAVGSPITVK